MIYYIDESCISVLDTGDEKSILLFEDLALKRRKCKNIVLGKRSVLEHIAKSKYLSAPVREIYRIIANRASEGKLLLSSVKKYCKIMGTPVNDRMTIQDGQEIIQISIAEAIDLDLTDLTIIVTENPDDVQLYKIIGQYYMKHSKVGNIKIAFEEKAGGGDTTGRVLEQVIKSKNRMCLCFVDSDKQYEGASPGNTMGKVMNIIKNQSQDFFEVVLLELQEIENLIPLNILERIGKDISNSQKGIDFYKFLISKANDMGDFAFYYFDIKKGISKKHFILKENATEQEKRAFRKREKYRNYWVSYITEYGEKIDITEEYVIPGICEKVLNHAIVHFQEMVREESYDKYKVNSYIEKFWLEYGKKIISWGCVGNRIAT